MNIYLVERSEDADYDENAALVVVAPDTEGARALAARQARDEGSVAWKTASVRRIGTALKKYTQPDTILVDYHAG